MEKLRIMKKSIAALALFTAVFVSCKKEEPKVTEPQLEEVQLEEKVSYLPTLEWTAYKTPEKIGVSGTFNTIELTGTKDSGKIEDDIKGAAFKITTSTVNSKDPLRDGKLAESFFKLMAGDITGKFVDFKNGKAVIEITMNGTTKQKEFAYTVAGESMNLKGVIDIIADFNATKAFNSIHELCKDLHAGKTFTEVDINVDITKK